MLVETLAQLSELHVATLSDRQRVSVASLDAEFELLKAGSSTLVVDGITVVRPTEGAPRAGDEDALWARVLVGSQLWAKRPTWFLSPATGDDENSGADADHPLRTHAELMRRIQGIMVSPGVGGEAGLDVTILDGPVDESIIIDVTAPDAFAYIYYHADPVPLHSGTITASTAYNDATGQDGLITDSALAVSWTASGLVGKLLRITAGPRAGTECWIAKDIGSGSKQARISQPAQPFQIAPGTIQDGDPYTVYDMIRFGNRIDAYIRGGPGAQINFETLELGQDGFNGGHEVETKVGTVIASSCAVNGFDAANSSSNEFYGCCFRSGCRSNVFGNLSLFNCLSFVMIQIRELSWGTLMRTIVQSPAASNGLIVTFGGIAYVATDSWFAVFDATNGVSLEEGAALTMRNAKLWGKGVTAVGVAVGSGGSVFYPAAKVPAITTPATQTTIGGEANAYGDLPFINPNNGAKIVISG